MLVRITTQKESLTELLENKGIRKAELARRLGYHKAYFTKIEKEQVVIPEKLYNRILEVFNQS